MPKEEIDRDLSLLSLANHPQTPWHKVFLEDSIAAQPENSPLLYNPKVHYMFTKAHH
jgi:hypothetical protein